MRIALRLAQRQLGQTAPNPAVGALIVDEVTGELIARGWTQVGGRPHAETHVLGRAGSRGRAQDLAGLFAARRRSSSASELSIQ